MRKEAIRNLEKKRKMKSEEGKRRYGKGREREKN